jgi:hypothetical protein
VAAFEELMTAMRQVVREKLAVRRRNDGIVLACKDKHGGCNVGQKCLEAATAGAAGALAAAVVVAWAAATAVAALVAVV